MTRKTLKLGTEMREIELDEADRFTAFDYDLQIWVTGAEARTLRIQQIREELDLIDSPEGPNYLYSVNAPANARALLAAQLAELEG